VIVNAPVRPAPRVDGDGIAIPRPSTSPRVPYQVRATRTDLAVRDPVLFTDPVSVTVPSGFATPTGPVDDSDGSEPGARLVAVSVTD